jgi:hypothetical protein
MSDSIVKEVSMDKFWHDLGVASDKTLLKAIVESIGDDCGAMQSPGCFASSGARKPPAAVVTWPWGCWG